MPQQLRVDLLAPSLSIDLGYVSIYQNGFNLQGRFITVILASLQRLELISLKINELKNDPLIHRITDRLFATSL